MTTITIFLPVARHSINPFCSCASEKTLESGNVILQDALGNCNMKVVASLILCFTTVSLADDFKLVTGKECKNVTVSRVEPDCIVLKTKSGISKVYFVELPNDVQQRSLQCRDRFCLFRTSTTNRQSGDNGRCPSRRTDRNDFSR